MPLYGNPENNFRLCELPFGELGARSEILPLCQDYYLFSLPRAILRRRSGRGIYRERVFADLEATRV